MDGLIAEHISKTYAGAHGLSLPRSGMCPFTWSPAPSPPWWESPAPGKAPWPACWSAWSHPDQGTISLDGEDTSGWNTEDWRESGVQNSRRSFRTPVGR